VDAVHAAPHLPIDVQELGCDFLACSAYKFFGPHIGVLWGRYELLVQLPAYKVRPANDRPPDKFESGTQNHEGIAGTLGALRYFEWLANDLSPQPLATRSGRLRAAMQAIRDSERGLSAALLEGLERVPGVRIRGIRSGERLAERVPTVSFTLDGHSPRAVARHLADRGIQVWDGNYYALAIAERLGVQESGGMVRVGAVHYNTVAEIERCVAAVAELAES
jgi:selenocysteine lyase/cysteine desulfurase